MQNEHRNSLRVLQWMMAASIALPLGLFVFAGWMAYRVTSESADTDIQRGLDVVYEHALKVFETIDLSLADIDGTLEGMSDDAVRAHAAELHIRLKRIAELLPQMKSAWIFDARGRAVANSIEPVASNLDFSDRDYFKAHVGRDIGLHVDKVLVPRAPYPGPPFFSVSRRRPSENGRFAGIVQASVLPQYFEQFYAKIARDEGSFFALGLPDGNVLARYPALDKVMQIDREGPVGTRIRAEPAGGLVTLNSTADGTERRVGYRRLTEYPVYIAAGFDTAAIRGRWMAIIARYLTFGLPATGLVFLILWLALKRTRSLYGEAERRQQAEDALARSQRLEALGQLTGGVAHDFNNLLTVIGSSVDLLRRPNLTEERRQRYVEAISTTVTRAAKLTAQLLAFARRQPLKPEVFEVNKSLASVGDIIGTLTGARIDVDIAVPRQPCFVNADLSQFETAMINLAVNARDAMNGEGVLKIAAQVPQTLPAMLSGAAADAYVAISVTDTGVGIPADEIDRIFDPFFTTKPMGRGTGLGLSQVFGFVKQTGGEVTVEAEVGRGSTFTLFLPLVAGAVNEEAQTAPRDSTGNRSLRILLVEDNPEVGAFAALSLTELGHTPLFVTNGVEALAELAKDATRFDIVFSDVMMPGMTGLDLGKEIRRLYPLLPVVLATGYSELLIENGRDGFELVQKPYTVDHLSRVFGGVINAQRPAAAAL